MSRGQGPVLALGVVAVGVFAAAVALWAVRLVATDGAVVATGGGADSEPQTPAAPARPRPTHFWVHVAEDDRRPWTAPDGEVIEGWRMRDSYPRWLDPIPDVDAVAGDAVAAAEVALPFPVEGWLYRHGEPRGPNGWRHYVGVPAGVPEDAVPDPALAGTWVQFRGPWQKSGRRWTLRPDGRLDAPPPWRSLRSQGQWGVAGGVLYLDARPSPESHDDDHVDRRNPLLLPVVVLDEDRRSGTFFGGGVLRRAE